MVSPSRPEAGSAVSGLSARDVARLGQAWSVLPDHQTLLDRVVAEAVSLIPRCDAAGISIVHHPGGLVDSPAVSGPTVAEADALQYELGEGPCLDAIWRDDTYVIEDLRRETRWPRWAPGAVALGLRSVLSVRLATTEDLIGGLNLYSHVAGAYDEDDVHTAHTLAAQAAVVISAAAQQDGLRTAMRTRHLIGMAQGILMVRHGLTPEMAFEVLRRYSAEENVKVRVVAERLVHAEGATAAAGDDPAACGPLPPA